MNEQSVIDRLLDFVIGVLSAPFDYLQRQLGVNEDRDNPHDPTFWL